MRPKPTTTAEYKAAIDELLAEIARMNEQMAHNQEEIERQKCESSIIDARIEAIGGRIDQRLRAIESLL